MVVFGSSVSVDTCVGPLGGCGGGGVSIVSTPWVTGGGHTGQFPLASGMTFLPLQSGQFIIDDALPLPELKTILITEFVMNYTHR